MWPERKVPKIGIEWMSESQKGGMCEKRWNSTLLRTNGKGEGTEGAFWQEQIWGEEWGNHRKLKEERKECWWSQLHECLVSWSAVSSDKAKLTNGWYDNAGSQLACLLLSCSSFSLCESYAVLFPTKAETKLCVCWYIETMWHFYYWQPASGPAHVSYSGDKNGSCILFHRHHSESECCVIHKRHTDNTACLKHKPRG